MQQIAIAIWKLHCVVRYEESIVSQQFASAEAAAEADHNDQFEIALAVTAARNNLLEKNALSDQLLPALEGCGDPQLKRLALTAWRDVATLQQATVPAEQQQLRQSLTAARKALKDEIFRRPTLDELNRRMKADRKIARAKASLARRSSTTLRVIRPCADGSSLV